MPTALDTHVEALQSLIAHYQGVASTDVGNLFSQIVGGLSDSTWSNSTKYELIKSLQDLLPTIALSHVGQVADATTVWYDDLAPDADFAPFAPYASDLVPLERIDQSIVWAVSTAQSMETAFSQLEGSVHRMVYDGQRQTVVQNAAKEKVKYLRHANYAGACNWCLVMAGRGAVYASATSAIKGHDNCKCIAVPLRPGMSDYTVPAAVKDAQVRYDAAAAKLKNKGESTSLDSILKQMDQDQADVVAGAEKAKVEEWLGAEKAFKKKESKAKAAKKFAEKKKAEKAKATTDWLAAEQKYKTDVTQWLVAEAQFKATAPKATNWAAKKDAEKTAAANQAAGESEPFTAPPAIPLGPAPGQSLIYVKSGGGSHGAAVYSDGTNEWLIKPQKHYKNLLDQTTGQLQKKTGLPAPDFHTVKVPEMVGEASAQSMLPGGIAYQQSIIPKSALKPGDILALQKNQVFDWLIANHDTHAQNFIRKPDGELVGVDKGQAFKWFGKDKLSWEFHPNKPTGEHEPIYNTLWKMAVAGDIEMIDPSGQNELHDYIQGVMAIPDAEFIATLKPFAQAAAADGKLTSATDGHGLLKKGFVPDNDVDTFLQMAVARKNNLQNDFNMLYTKHLVAQKKPAPQAPPAPTIAQPAAPALDVNAAIKAQKKNVADFIVQAHVAVKNNHLLDANDYLDYASDAQYASIEKWAGDHPNAVIEEMAKIAASPAHKALQDYQNQKAHQLTELYDQGLITKEFLAEPGGLAGITAQQYKEALTMTPSEFEQTFPKLVAQVEPPLADWEKELLEQASKPAESLDEFFSHFDVDLVAQADADWAKLTSDQQFKIGKQKAAMKFAANKKGDLAKVAQINAMTKAEYNAWKNGILPADYKATAGATSTPAKPAGNATPVTPPPPPPPPPLQSPTVDYLGQDFDILLPEFKKKAAKQLAAAKFAAKKKTTKESKLEVMIYDNWTGKDWYAAKYLKENPGLNPMANTSVWTKEKLTQLQAQEYELAKAAHEKWMIANPNHGAEIDSPYWGAQQTLKWLQYYEYQNWMLDHGQTSVLGSPLSPSPKIFGGTVSSVKPPKNPPTDPAKLAKVQELQAAYLQAKPGGTGFNPVKGFDPTGSLKSNIDSFDTEIGVGYLTDDQLFQTLSKLPNSYQIKYLKKYADAKGQNAADAVQLKLHPLGSPSVAAPASSAGVGPSIHSLHSYGNNWKANVVIKPGTTHTPVRNQAVSSVIADLNSNSKNVVPDSTAPLGSSQNPHVFSQGDMSYKVFGSMITDQHPDAWQSSQYSKIRSYTSSGYASTNEKLRVDLANMLDKWDEAAGKMKIDPATGQPYDVKVPSSIKTFDNAFESPATSVNEEWVVLTRGTSRREFNDNDVAGLDPFHIGGHHGTVAELKVLEGHTYIQRGIGSTSIADKPAFSSKHIRVIYRVPPGTKMIYVDGDPSGTGITNCSGEREVLLPRNTRCKVLEVREGTAKAGQVDVIVEVIGQEKWP